MKDWSFGKKLSFGVLLFIIVVFIGVSLVGCTTEPPTPFKLGVEVHPPVGCVEYRQRGGEC